MIIIEKQCCLVDQTGKPNSNKSRPTHLCTTLFLWYDWKNCIEWASLTSECRCVPRLLEHKYLVWEHVFLEFLTWLITFFHCSWLLSNGKQLSLHREKRPCNNGFPLSWCDHSSLLEREPKNWYGEHIGICMPRTNRIQPVLTQCSQASK
jgi:hypothetical protein